MISLPVELDKVGFVEREKNNGVTVKNKCGRDFLYYACNYYLPERFNTSSLSPVDIEHQGLFGLSLPAYLAWTQLQFYKLPRFLKENKLSLAINNKNISTFTDFVVAILFSRMPYKKAINTIEHRVNSGYVVGVDVSLGFFGLLDHVMFVYGYDKDNLYVLDTHNVPRLHYERMTEDNRYFMKLSKKEILERWSIFSRVWEVSRLH